ncbi:AEC family transporter [Halomonas icarae]|uniref:AEC family transporter n=1 Tax=Halomonas icarae TaxID=2691040 RepID=A0A7X5ANT6_9GAMM|nr:AEC family transporter [Halomonas icarae]MDR5903376.1 AEC family transporter [Halomonas icarae]NAW14264.1 AEC family transporter [Halomonas icarae]
MLEILTITLPIFILIGAGFLAAFSGLLSRDNMQGIATFVMFFALPSLLIRALTATPLEKALNIGYLLAYGLGSVLVFAAGLALSRWRGHALDAAAIHALGMSAANSGFIGYPVAVMVIGAPAAIFMALNMVVETLLIIPMALTLAEASRHNGGGLSRVVHKTLARLSRNPVLIGLLTGVTLALTGWQLPTPLAKAIDMLAEAAGPAALFTIGGMLHGLKVRGMAADMGQIVIGKLLLHPLAVLAFLLLLPESDPMMIAGGLLFACAPMISVYPLFGKQFDQGDTSAAALMVGTLASFLTISLSIWLLTLFDLLPI